MDQCLKVNVKILPAPRYAGTYSVFYLTDASGKKQGAWRRYHTYPCKQSKRHGPYICIRGMQGLEFKYLLAEGHFEDNLLEGDQITYGPDGTKVVTPYHKGLKMGLQKTYLPNGQIRYAEYWQDLLVADDAKVREMWRQNVRTRCLEKQRDLAERKWRRKLENKNATVVFQKSLEV